MVKRSLSGLDEAKEKEHERTKSVPSNSYGLPRTSGLTDKQVMLRYWERKKARESGDLEWIRHSFGAPPLGRISKKALGSR
jgi:hypothetical protein